MRRNLNPIPREKGRAWGTYIDASVKPRVIEVAKAHRITYRLVLEACIRQGLKPGSKLRVTDNLEVQL